VSQRPGGKGRTPLEARDAILKPFSVDAVLGLPPVEVELRILWTEGVALVQTEERLDGLADEGGELPREKKTLY
jgi:hypothetical protein